MPLCLPASWLWFCCVAASSNGLRQKLLFVSLELQAAVSPLSAQCKVHQLTWICPVQPFILVLSTSLNEQGDSKWQREKSEEKYSSPLSFAKKEQHSCSKFWFSSFSPVEQVGPSKNTVSLWFIAIFFLFQPTVHVLVILPVYSISKNNQQLPALDI